MKVYLVNACVCDEYGCMACAGVFTTRKAAYNWAITNGYQDKDEGEAWNWRTDFFEIIEHEISE